MSRDLKFRAWDKRNKRMICDCTRFSIENGSVYQMLFWGNVKVNLLSDDFILMQYTGRKDKNGVEIYEGDDVDVSMSFEGGTLPHRGIIVYDETFGAFGTKNEAGVTLLHNHCLHTLEVIGHIHEVQDAR